jgi:hypothetical protein
MQSAAFSYYVWVIVGVSLGLLFLLTLVFQAMTVQFRDTERELEVIQESRALWLGGIGLLPMAVLITLLGFIAIGTQVLTNTSSKAFDRVLGALAQILVPISSALTQLKDTVRI